MGNSANSIAYIKVERLFGLYSYRIPDNGDLRNAAILYGDNGVGKSTILKLVFHLLSPATDRGHRSALLKAVFSQIEVGLSSGVAVIARRIEVPDSNESQHMLQLRLERNGTVLAGWDHQKRESPTHKDSTALARYLSSIYSPDLHTNGKNADKSAQPDFPFGETIYYKELQKHVPNIFILDAERRMESDAVSDPGDELEIRRMMSYENVKRVSDLATRSREIALSQAMEAANASFTRKVVQGTNQGVTNVHSVYLDVLKKLALEEKSFKESQSAHSLENVSERVRRIDEMTNGFAQYDLSTHLDMTQMLNLLGQFPPRSMQLSLELVSSYVDGLESRLRALEPIYQLLDRFIDITNNLLRDKEISYKVGKGFAITNNLGHVLEANQLSSGEQQLLLLFCRVLTARDQASVFMIDEPEISLNIKWQRELVRSLLTITEGANIQFMFASHSIELIAKHSDRVVQLKSMN